MEKVNRTDAPAWLAAKWEVWGREWEEKFRTTEKASAFSWRRYQNKGRTELAADLSAMTQHHCSFCDAHPMGSRIKETIEHFKPKSKFPLLAYQWENLFICCGICQEKGDEFHDMLLKPDVKNYDFDDYFDIDWVTGKLMPNAMATPDNRARAELTIKLYKLNEYGKPDDRLLELAKFSDENNIDQYSYRFFLKRGGLS
jgi:uncharacterized protein (TIGR02646 family)